MYTMVALIGRGLGGSHDNRNQEDKTVVETSERQVAAVVRS